MLNAIDQLYQEHLYAMDDLRQGVALRAYGQRDPLVEYKQEAYGMFSGLLEAIKDQILSNMFRSATTVTAFQHLMDTARQQEQHDSLGQFGGVGEGQAAGQAPSPTGAPALPPGITIRRHRPKVGRNASCPCGSGKKYKQCCGRL